MPVRRRCAEMVAVCCCSVFGGIKGKVDCLLMFVYLPLVDSTILSELIDIECFCDLCSLPVKRGAILSSILCRIFEQNFCTPCVLWPLPIDAADDAWEAVGEPGLGGIAAKSLSECDLSIS